jgi:hypothetical protein
LLLAATCTQSTSTSTISSNTKAASISTSTSTHAPQQLYCADLSTWPGPFVLVQNNLGTSVHIPTIPCCTNLYVLCAIF